MGLFGKKKDQGAPVAPRQSLEDRTVTPTADQLHTYLMTAGGSYYAKDGDKDPETWGDVRKAADRWLAAIGVGSQPVNHLAYLVPANDPAVIWVEVDGWRVDRLTRSAVAAWGGTLTEPLPVVCTLRTIGGKGHERPSVQLHTKRVALG